MPKRRQVPDLYDKREKCPLCGLSFAKLSTHHSLNPSCREKMKAWVPPSEKITKPPASISVPNIPIGNEINDVDSDEDDEGMFDTSFPEITPASEEDGSFQFNANHSSEDDGHRRSARFQNAAVVVEEEMSSDDDSLDHSDASQCYKLDREDEHMFQIPASFDSKYMAQFVEEGKIKRSNNDCLSPEELNDRDLHHILRGFPKTLWGRLRQWRYDSQYKYKHIMDHSYPKTDKYASLKSIEKRYGLECNRATIKTVFLPNLKVRADLVIFPFAANLARLLADPEAMLAENLLIDPNNLDKPPVLGGTDNQYADVNTGSLYVDAWSKRCKGRVNHILAALILFIDKSWVDRKGKLTLEPVMCTTSLFNRKFRNKPEAWFELGYIPNMDHLNKRADATDKLKDYHYCLKIILSEMIACQNLKDGLEWDLLVDETYTRVNLHIPLLYVIGDTEGHDKLCGRKVDRASGTSRQCRSCDVEHHECDKPTAKVNLTKCADIRKMKARKEYHKLRDHCYKDIELAFDHVDFCDNIRGIHGATPADILHTIQLGLEEKIIVRTLNMKKILQDAKKWKGRKKGKRKVKPKQVIARKKQSTAQRNESSPPEEDSDDEHADNGELYPEETEEMDNPMVDREYEEEIPYHDEPQTTRQSRVAEEEESREVESVLVAVAPEDESKRGVFGPKECEMIDSKCSELHKQLRWQSDTDMPRTSFPVGLTSLAKMTGSERTGVLLVLLLILCMDSYEYEIKRSENPDYQFKKRNHAGWLSSRLTPERKRNVIKNISLVLQFEAFLRSDKIPANCIEDVDAFVKELLWGVSITFPKPDGTGHATIKHHLASHHMVSEIPRVGTLQNSDSSRMESNHKISIKMPGKNTQRRMVSFAQQVSSQVHNCRVVDRAYRDSDRWIESRLPDDPEEHITVSAPWITITQHNVFNGRGGGKDITDSVKELKNDILNGRHLLKLVRNNILPFTEEKSVTLHVTFKKDGVTYQANPDYGKHRLPRQHWGVVKTTTINSRLQSQTSKVGMHFLCILHFPTQPTKEILLDRHLENGVTDCGAISQAGYYVLGNVLTQELTCKGESEWGSDWDYGTLAEENQKMIHAARKAQVEQANNKRRNGILAVKLERICGPMIGVKDPTKNKYTNHDYYYFIVPRRDWGQLFIEGAREEKLRHNNLSDEEREKRRNEAILREEEHRRQLLLAPIDEDSEMNSESDTDQES